MRDTDEKNKEIRLKSALSLAYIGDAVYELMVRESLLRSVNANPAMLHRFTVSWVNAKAQRMALEKIEPILSSEELEIAHRGRNSSKAAVPRTTNPRDYRAATALEALFGYLYLNERRQRLRELFAVIAADIENNPSFLPTE